MVVLVILQLIKYNAPLFSYNNKFCIQLYNFLFSYNIYLKYKLIHFKSTYRVTHFKVQVQQQIDDILGHHSQLVRARAFQQNLGSGFTCLQQVEQFVVTFLLGLQLLERVGYGVQLLLNVDTLLVGGQDLGVVVPLQVEVCHHVSDVPVVQVKIRIQQVD